MIDRERFLRIAFENTETITNRAWDLCIKIGDYHIHMDTYHGLMRVTYSDALGSFICKDTYDIFELIAFIQEKKRYD